MDDFATLFTDVDGFRMDFGEMLIDFGEILEGFGQILGGFGWIWMDFRPIWDPNPSQICLNPLNPSESTQFNPKSIQIQQNPSQICMNPLNP